MALCGTVGGMGQESRSRLIELALCASRTSRGLQMGQKHNVTKLPDSIVVEQHGEVVRLSWNHRGPNPCAMIFKAVLVALMLLLSFGFLIAKSCSAGPWVLLVMGLFCGLVGFVLILTALRWFWDESIELRPETLTQIFRGPLAPRPKELRRSAIVDIHFISDPGRRH